MAISILPQSVIEKIAAGEVAVSPAAVIKEMLENSLDARSQTVRIVLTDAVTDRIEIEDDGDGVAEKDLPMLCTRHATSKIRSYEDIEKVSTLGFRGEALFSLSMVSDMSVTTAQKEGAGTHCTYRGAALTEKKEAPSKKGTKIVIRDLFYNDPLKKDAFTGNRQELKKISAIVMKYAACYWKVRFEVVQGTRTQRYNPSSTATKIEAISQIFSHHLYNSLIEVPLSASDMKGVCYVTHSNAGMKTGVTVIFVNKRLVEVPKIKRAVLNIYKEVLVKGQPFIYIEIDVPAEKIDPNVHPSKIEVHLKDEEKIVEEIENKIKKTVESKRLIGKTKIPKISSQEEPKESTQTAPKTQKHKDARTSETPRSDPATAPKNPSQITSRQTQAEYTPPSKKIRTDPQIAPLSLFLSPKVSLSRHASPLKPPTQKSAPSITSVTRPIPIAATHPPSTAAAHSASAQDQNDLFFKNPLKNASIIGNVSKNWVLLQKDTDLLLFDMRSALVRYFTSHFHTIFPDLLSHPSAPLPREIVLVHTQASVLISEDLALISPHTANEKCNIPSNIPSNMPPNMPSNIPSNIPLNMPSNIPLSTTPPNIPILIDRLSEHFLHAHPYLSLREIQRDHLPTENLSPISNTTALYQLFNR